MKFTCLLFVVLLTFRAVEAQKFSTLALLPANSIFDEQNPVLSPDGKTLWLTMANHPQNVGGKKDSGDIWYSTWTGTQWSIPVHGEAVLNDRGYNAVIGISPDGLQLFLANHYSTDETPAKSQGISYVTKSGTTWSKPVAISIPYFLNRSLSFSGFVSLDGNTLVYSAEAYDTRGAEDLYVSTRHGNSWSEPRNLGSVINTSFQELTPTLSADQHYLYFASNGRNGYGSFDIYYCERLDDSWTKWSVPVNMGSRINTEGRELYYRTFPQWNMALFTSTQNSDGYGDIRSYSDSLPNLALDTLVKMVEVKHEHLTGADAKIATVKGMVSDSRTGQPVLARLNFKSDSVKSVSSNKQGNYSIKISSTDQYTIVVEAQGYVGVLEKLDIHTFEMHDVELNFKLQPIEVGATVNLKNVLFKVGTTDLLKESYDELNVVVDLLKSNPKIEIELAGHTDNRGDAHQNLKLSQSRVNSVKKYLVSMGISAKRIKGKGYGGQKPLTQGDSEESRRLNRRVEFTIVKD
jgi:OmpA-OmpF porin, OOP family